MVRKRRETLDDLLRLAGITDERGLTAFALEAGTSPKTLFRLRKGKVKNRPHAGTVALLVAAFARRGIAAERVRAALGA